MGYHIAEGVSERCIARLLLTIHSNNGILNVTKNGKNMCYILDMIDVCSPSLVCWTKYSN